MRPHSVTSVKSFVVGEPAIPDQAQFCHRCSSDRQCDDGLCVAEGTGFCGLDCFDDSCPPGTACREVTSRGGLGDRQCVPTEFSCGELQADCADDTWEDDNDAPGTAPAIAVGQRFRGRICPDDIDLLVARLEDNVQYEVVADGWYPRRPIWIWSCSD